MKKLLVICGPTATGKTSLALKLAKKYRAEIISADSRQVYRGLNIGTGKDLPKGAKHLSNNPKLGGYYLVKGVRIWGYDLVGPTNSFGVGNYIKTARKILRDIQRRGKLPIIVGGTGLYIKGVVEGIGTALIPINASLRKSLESKDVDKLFEVLAGLDPTKVASMNSSDRKNPRRLIRAIEVADYEIRNVANKKVKPINADVLLIGLKLSNEDLQERIVDRVKKRIEQGLIEEVKELLLTGVSWDNQSMSSLGYGQWRSYLGGNESQDEAVDKWTRDEIKYAKRQMVWFKKQKGINWFDVSNVGEVVRIEKLLDKWHNKNKRNVRKAN